MITSEIPWMSKNKLSEIKIGIHVEDSFRIQEWKEKDLVGDKFKFEIRLLICRSVIFFNSAP